ncbi:hypothetical protein OG588_17380 [Streptomyces prunicolor]|uniref:hypothetical protein n=1 Tax=Streptomyces prunicolor TaxID=67348 RepID=UPI0038652C3F|nr:hypothetical protein OG588_17380 [Streptomyces prunicolor]
MVDEPEAAVSGVASGPPRSRLADIADQTVIRTARETVVEVAVEVAVEVVSEEETEVETEVEAEVEAAQVRARRRRFLDQLGEFRRSQVLVPMGALPGVDPVAEAPLTVDLGGVRWILAFTGEAALARYAAARGEAEREWRYRGVWGAALLDAAVPTVAGSGVPCGVLVDAADGERGLVLPPVVGVVPEDVAVDGPDGPGGLDGLDGEVGR